MKSLAKGKRILLSLGAGLSVGLIAMWITVSLATAAPPHQADQPAPTADPQSCGDCHLDVATAWKTSPHAHAFDDANYQERWHAMGDPGNCLLCHTTNYQATTGEFDAAGVSCEACHGKIDPNHPPASVPIRADTEYCGTCHTTTLGEWRLTGHAHADVGCTDCHDPHSQQALFENPDQMCLNCHKDSMGEYLEDLHGQKGIGCVDCHALVIPPEEPPADGIVPTGHTFTITPATCVACHTDALHSGFSLPGYENGAKAATAGIISEAKASKEQQNAIIQSPEERLQMMENQVQALTAANASRSMTVLFQGGVVGLVLGSSTAWVVANNVRRGRKEDEDDR
jgi:predicted CXXCH cytochrome family protein